MAAYMEGRSGVLGAAIVGLCLLVGLSVGRLLRRPGRHAVQIGQLESSR